MGKNLIMVDLEDNRTDKIADVISNKTAKKILGLLAENELSESELAKGLNIPLNTIGYNIKKLEEVELIEKIQGFLWSVKGKRIHKYKVSNKKIVISPRRMIKGIIPAVLISGAVAFGIKILSDLKLRSLQEMNRVNEKASDFAMEVGVGASSAGAAKSVGVSRRVVEIAQNLQDIWLWFLAGALFALLIYLIWNWRRT